MSAPLHPGPRPSRRGRQRHHPAQRGRGAGGGPSAGRCRRGRGLQRVLERGRRGGRRQHRRRGTAPGAGAAGAAAGRLAHRRAPAAARGPPRSPRRAAARRVAVSSRSAERAGAFERWCGDAGSATGAGRRSAAWSSMPPRSASAPMIPLPLEPDAVPRAEVAFDMVYRTGETPWVRAMRASGRRAADGRGMLVAQGAGGPPALVSRASILPSRSCGPWWMPRFAELRARAGGARALAPAGRMPPLRRADRRARGRRAGLCALPFPLAAGARAALRPLRPACIRRSRLPDLRRLDSGAAPGPKRGVAGRVARDSRSIGSSTRAGGGWRSRWPRRCEASSH